MVIYFVQQSGQIIPLPASPKPLSACTATGFLKPSSRLLTARGNVHEDAQLT